jgi:drug/metabolite transporter (DMT)-like permease
MIFATIQQTHWNWEAYTNHVVMGNILFLSIVASGICFFMWRWAILRIGATQTSNYIYLVPIINSIAAGFILKEEITIQLFIAGVLILSGLYVSQKYSIVEHY